MLFFVVVGVAFLIDLCVCVCGGGVCFGRIINILANQVAKI